MKTVAILASTLVLGACAASEGYPSLAKRPFETTAGAPLAPAPPPPVAPADPAVVARVNAALDRAKASQGPFAAALAKAKPQVAAAAGAASGSERWIAGQMAASSVEPLREPAASALTELDDELRVATVPADRAAIEAAIVEASEIVTRQQRDTAALSASLPD